MLGRKAIEAGSTAEAIGKKTGFGLAIGEAASTSELSERAVGGDYI